MEKSPLAKYILRLIKDAHQWQYRSLTEEIKSTPKAKGYFLPIQWLFLLVSLLLVIFVKSAINKDLAGYIIAALSIFIGLYISLIMMIFDKFGSTSFDTKNESLTFRIALLKKRNFFWQFTSLTSYCILIAILLIVLLSFCFFDSYIKEINTIGAIQYVIDLISNDYERYWSIDAAKSAIFISSILVTRFLTYYFLLDFMMILVYAICSTHSYITKEYKDKKIEIYELEIQDDEE